jgi:TP53 regulating kinase-like protein
MGEAAMTQRLIKKGAEASLYLANWHDRQVIIKTRLPKRYRPQQLDLTIRRYRTVHEPQLMHEAKRAGVSTPAIFLVDAENASIVMEYIAGRQVKQMLDTASEAQRHKLCVDIGTLIGKLHRHGLVHGDLTTSNMILTDESKVFLVDFGLGEKNAELEAQGVDLHLFRRALQSTHFTVADACFHAVLEGYSAVLGEEVAARVLAKIREIEKRGRYIAERQQDTQ